MGGAIRVDWQAIKSRWGTEVSVPHLCIVPKGFASLVLAIQERLHWEATYRIEGYDFADWDTLQAIVDEGLAGLTDTMRLSDLITHVDELETLLQAIVDKPICCDADFIGEELQDPDGIIGIEEEPPGDDIVWGEGDPPGDAIDWTEATLERCGAAETFAANLHRWVGLSEALQELGEVVSVTLFVGAVAAVAPALGLTALAGMLSIGSLTFLMNLLQTALDAGPDFTAARNELQDENVIGKIVCAIIGSDTAASAEIAVDTVLEQYAPNAYPMMQALPLRYMMGAIFNADHTSGGFAGPCRDCGTFNIQLYNVRTGSTEHGPGLVPFQWYDIPNALLPQQSPNWRRAHVRVHTPGGIMVNANIEVRAVNYCNGAVADDNPYFNNAFVTRVDPVETVVDQHPGLPSFSYEGIGSEAAITSDTGASCTDFVLQIRILDYPV